MRWLRFFMQDLLAMICDKDADRITISPGIKVNWKMEVLCNQLTSTCVVPRFCYKLWTVSGSWAPVRGKFSCFPEHCLRFTFFYPTMFFFSIRCSYPTSLIIYPLLFIKLAKWLLLFPGAAQASITWDPVDGASTCAGRQLAWVRRQHKKINL